MTTPAPLNPSDLAAPLAITFAQIIRGLIALMARVFARHPVLALRVIPYCNRLNRAAQRFTILMARLAAGRYRPRTARPDRRTNRPAQPGLPARKAWLLHIMQDHPLRHEAAIFATQLDHYLSQPGIPELLAAHPAAQRLLNPVRHFLGLPTTRKPRAPKPRPAPKPRIRPRRPRSWTQILAADAALHPRPALRKKP